jgi:hypothetical protein
MLLADFWQNEREILRATLLPLMEKYGVAGVDKILGELTPLGLGFDSALAHAQAANWARQHTDDLLNLLGTTNERVVGEVVANWAETPGATMGQLTQRLQQVLDANEERAAMIAATEVTRAYAQGESLANREAGLPKIAFAPPAHPNCRCFPANKLLGRDVWVTVWQTRRDEVVCKTARINTPWGRVLGCRELHNRVISAGPLLGQTISEARRAARALQQ